MKRRHLYYLIPVVVVIGVVALPVLNLITDPDNRSVLPKRTDGVPLWKKTSAIFAKKCVHCHSEKATRPFYARLPVARGMMRSDVRNALSILDMPAAFYRKGAIPISEAAVAKVEFALDHNTMPPTRYLLLHWNHRLNDTDKKVLRDWIRQTRKKFFLTRGVAKAFENDPIQPLPEAIALNPAKVDLGRRLFHDKRLSKDNTVSCASCHGLDKGGTDRLRFSEGIRKQIGGINSPTVYNSGFQFVQFWDGRAADLAEQAKGPVENPIEMGSSWPEVTEKLKQDPELMTAIRAVYPDGLTDRNVRDAIAEFEMSLITPGRMDRHLRGDDKALTDEEKKGFKVFKDKGCAMCHVGKVLGGQSFEKMGLHKDYFAKRGNVKKEDLGRYNVTKKTRDRYRFKVPMLRNIVITPPFFHDGSTSDLGKAVEIMADHQFEEPLSKSEIRAVVAFLKALTGTYQGKKLQ